MSDPLRWLEAELSDLHRRHLLRRLTTHVGGQGPKIVVAGREYLNFGANDYLNLSSDPRLADAAARATLQEGWGAGASPLVTGHANSHARLERRLAQFTGCEGALVFSSGFAANVGTIAALVERGDAIYGDQKNHASIIDGCRLSRADVHVYPHRDVAALRQLLRLPDSRTYRRRLIVTDTLFSMDGDVAPLVELADLAEEFDCLLMVDEAHATGVFGEHGRGLCEQLGVEARVHVRVGTLSKALACAGGFVAGRGTLIEWLVNRARPYVFSTAHPPAIAAAAIAAIDIVEHEPQRRRELLARAADLRTRLQADGWNVGSSTSQIIPLLVGAPAATMELSAALNERGLFVPGIRPPSVPPGESLLRLSLSYGHTPQMLEQLLAGMRAVRRLG